jgi:hypothetical protein
METTTPQLHTPGSSGHTASRRPQPVSRPSPLRGGLRPAIDPGSEPTRAPSRPDRARKDATTQNQTLDRHRPFRDDTYRRARNSDLAVQPSVQPSRPTQVGRERRPTSRAGHRQRLTKADNPRRLCKAVVDAVPVGRSESLASVVGSPCVTLSEEAYDRAAEHYEQCDEAGGNSSKFGHAPKPTKIIETPAKRGFAVRRRDRSQAGIRRMATARIPVATMPRPMQASRMPATRSAMLTAGSLAGADNAVRPSSRPVRP